MGTKAVLKDQLPDEEVVRVVRRDTIVLFKRSLSFIFAMVVVSVTGFLITDTFPSLIESSFYPLIILAVHAFILFSWLFFFLSLTDYVLDVWYITNKRIIDIQQEGFFSRKISEQYLNRIQDVTSETVGVLPTIFRYGDVRVQTAGEQEHFLFHEVPEPEQVRQLIMELSQKSNEIHEHHETNEQTAIPTK